MLTAMESLRIDTTPIPPITIYETHYRLSLHEVDQLSLPTFSKLYMVCITR